MWPPAGRSMSILALWRSARSGIVAGSASAFRAGAVRQERPSAAPHEPLCKPLISRSTMPIADFFQLGLAL